MAIENVSYVRSLVFISISGYLLVRARSGIDRVIRKDIGITVDTFEENDLRTFPLMTFCPLMKNVIDLTQEDLKFSDVVQRTPNLEEIFAKHQNKAELPGKWTKTYKFFSHIKYGSKRLVQACFTYQHGRNIKVGSTEDHLTFMIKMKNVDEMLLTVHEQFGYVNTHYHLDGRKTPIIEWLNPNYYRVIRIDVEPQMYKKLEIEKNGKSEDVCKYQNDKECLEHVIERDLDCSVPWNFNETRSQVRPCSDEKDLKRIIDMIPDERKVSPKKLKYYLKTRGCSLPCDYIFYEPRIIYDLIDEWTENTELELGLGKQELELVVQLWNGERNIKEEALVFDYASFIGDIGGYVGLLLGYSLLSLFDSIYDYGMDIYRLLSKRRQKRKNEGMVTIGQRATNQPIGLRRSSVRSLDMESIHTLKI